MVFDNLKCKFLPCLFETTLSHLQNHSRLRAMKTVQRSCTVIEFRLQVWVAMSSSSKCGAIPFQTGGFALGSQTDVQMLLCVAEGRSATSHSQFWALVGACALAHISTRSVRRCQLSRARAMAANAMRENASKNNLVRAREAVRRFPELKALCRKFVSRYEKRTEDEDPKFGFRKYKARGGCF